MQDIFFPQIGINESQEKTGVINSCMRSSNPCALYAEPRRLNISLN